MEFDFVVSGKLEEKTRKEIAQAYRAFGGEKTLGALSLEVYRFISPKKRKQALLEKRRFAVMDENNADSITIILNALKGVAFQSKAQIVKRIEVCGLYAATDYSYIRIRQITQEDLLETDKAIYG